MRWSTRGFNTEWRIFTRARRPLDQQVSRLPDLRSPITVADRSMGESLNSDRPSLATHPSRQPGQARTVLVPPAPLGSECPALRPLTLTLPSTLSRSRPGCDAAGWCVVGIVAVWTRPIANRAVVDRAVPSNSPYCVTITALFPRICRPFCMKPLSLANVSPTSKPVRLPLILTTRSRRPSPFTSWYE